MAVLCPAQQQAFDALRRLRPVNPVSVVTGGIGAGKSTVLRAVHLPAPAADRLDYAKIYRFAPKLNAHQLRGACQWFQADAMLDTARFIDYLRSQHLASNVDLGEVQALSFQDLKGIDSRDAHPRR